MTRQRLTFIGRQYHSKTRSDHMMLNLLKEHFEVSLLRREQYSDRELVREVNALDPEIVFFWCLPPSVTKHLWKMKCKNVVWAPMWDGFRPLNFRRRLLMRLSKIKILCFSRALYHYFVKTHIQTAYWQCALPPNFQDFKEKPPYTLFLWQRESLINLDQIVKLLGEENIQKVIYKSEIGSCAHKEYSFEIEMLKDWLPYETYRAKIAEADFYVAPRQREGIGFSFLEALSQGKVILAYDESTMNEYLVDGENGFLFDQKFKLRKPLKSPKALSVSMQQIAQDTYERWEKTKKEIIPFLEKQ